MDASTSEEMVLGMLADAGDACVPGDILAGKLGLAPAQVFRHVEALRRKGYRIDTLGSRGYRLVAIPDRLTPLEIGPFLTTHDLGRGIRRGAQLHLRDGGEVLVLDAVTEDRDDPGLRARRLVAEERRLARPAEDRVV